MVLPPEPIFYRLIINHSAVYESAGKYPAGKEAASGSVFG
jgi:hypothetical protein